MRQATTSSVSTLTSVEHYLNLFNPNRLDYDTIPPVSYDLVVFLSNRFNMEVSYRLDEISDNISVLCQVLRNKLLDPEILKKIIGTIKLPPADILITLQCLSFKNKIGIENGKVLIQVSSIDEKTLRFLIEKRLPYEIQKKLRHKLYFLNRKSFEAFGGLIQFLYANRNYREALKYIHDAPHAFTQISQVKILQASCYRHCGLYEQGENLLLPLVNVDESAVTNLINIFTDNKKVKLARRLFEKNSKRIESPVFWYNGVSIANDPKEAVTFLE